MKKKTLMLHIGATKTGSSALQSMLFANRNLLKRNGVLYPETGVASGAHHHLFSAIHPNAWKMHGYSNSDNKNLAFRNMAHEINEKSREGDFNKIVLSSEYLWGVFHEKLYHEFSEAFQGWTVELVAAVRRIDYWTEANYIQAAKSGVVGSFSKWLEKFSQNPTVGFNFDRVISGWSDAVNPRRVHVVPYEPFNAKTFLSEISAALLGKVVAEQLPAPESRNDNPSPTEEGIMLIQNLYNSDMSEAARKEQISHIIRTHSRGPGTSSIYFMSPRERSELLKNSVPSNKAILTKYMPDREHLFKDPWPKQLD